MSKIKQLKDVFVIVYLQGQYEFFEGAVTSSDKEALERKCASLNKAKNKEHNAYYKKQWLADKRKNKAPFAPHETVFWRVLSLDKAIDEYRDIVADANTEHDESY